MNKSSIIGGTIGTILSATGTAMQTSEVLQIISLVVTIIGAIISMIVVPLVTWYQKAKKDGKITAEEINEGVKTLQEGIDDTQKVIDEHTKGGKE